MILTQQHWIVQQNDEDLHGWNGVLLQLLHMFATWMLSITIAYWSCIISLYKYVHRVALECGWENSHNMYIGMAKAHTWHSYTVSSLAGRSPYDCACARCVQSWCKLVQGNDLLLEGSIAKQPLCSSCFHSCPTSGQTGFHTKDSVTKQSDNTCLFRLII